MNNINIFNHNINSISYYSNAYTSDNTILLCTTFAAVDGQWPDSPHGRSGADVRGNVRGSHGDTARIATRQTKVATWWVTRDKTFFSLDYLPLTTIVLLLAKYDWEPDKTFLCIHQINVKIFKGILWLYIPTHNKSRMLCLRKCFIYALEFSPFVLLKLLTLVHAPNSLSPAAASAAFPRACTDGRRAFVWLSFPTSDRQWRYGCIRGRNYSSYSISHATKRYRVKGISVMYQFLISD